MHMHSISYLSMYVKFVLLTHFDSLYNWHTCDSLYYWRTRDTLH